MGLFVAGGSIRARWGKGMPFPEPLRADEEGLRGRHPPLFSTVFTYEDADGMLQTPSHTLMGSAALHQVSSRAGREECHFLKRETTTYGGGGPLSAALCCSRSADVCAIPPTSFPSKVTNMKRLKKRLEKEHGKEKVKGELGCDFYPPTFILPSVSTRTGHSYGTLSHRHSRETLVGCHGRPLKGFRVQPISISSRFGSTLPRLCLRAHIPIRLS